MELQREARIELADPREDRVIRSVRRIAHFDAEGKRHPGIGYPLGKWNVDGSHRGLSKRQILHGTGYSRNGDISVVYDNHRANRVYRSKVVVRKRTINDRNRRPAARNLSL